jgi:hypothetical protein
MKKQLVVIALLIAGLSIEAQVQRVSLYEEFTGETCPPCATTNPGLDALLKSGTNPSKIIPIKWQVPIPSAPSNTWSLYQTNKTEINWRYQSYGYGINSAPSGRIDGQNATVFGAASDHPANLNNNVINNAAAKVTPFAISMNRDWDNTYSNVTVTVNISSQGNFTAAGNLVFRLVLIEREIRFATQPGTNGEKDFNWAVRKSYPSTNFQAGTAMASNWTNGQTQTIVLTCALPSYIIDKTQVDFVGFIQDDGNRKVMQAARTGTMALANDAQAMPFLPYACGGNFVPKINVYNNGSNAITAFDINPRLDGVSGSVYNWNGNLAVGANTIISLSSGTLSQGVHTFSYSISNVSGTDFNLKNNSVNKKLFGLADYDATPILQDFSPNFPPPNWVVSSSNSTSNWAKSFNVGGFGLSNECAKVDLFLISAGAEMDMLLQPVDLAGSITPSLSFDLAYAQDAGSSNDRLQVSASSDCGDTWTVLYDKSGANLATRSALGISFVPTDADWITETVELSGFNNSNVLVKFTATSDNGNNLYVDNIDLQQLAPTTNGIAPNMNQNMSIDLFPNPSNGETTLKIESNGSASAKITVMNVLGQTVYSQPVNLVAGTNKLLINAAEFAPGVYHVLVDSKIGSVVKKLNVTE